MRKKFMFAVLALIGLGSFAVLGSSPELVGKMFEFLSQTQVSTFFSFPTERDDILSKLGKSKRVPRTNESKAVERPESVLWHVVFDFAKKLEVKGEELDQKGQDGNLYRNFFTRQGPLSAENDLILKRLAGQDILEIEPIEQRAKKIIEDRSAKYSKEAGQVRTFSESSELRELQLQKNEITLRYRDAVKTAFGKDVFDNFVTFLGSEFSQDAKTGKVSTAAVPEGIFYDAYSWIVWDDDQQPPLITGFSELYFFFETYGYDPSLDSYFVNATTSSVLDFGFADGYRDIFPAQYFHPTFFSIRGQQYCTLTDHYAVLYDGPFPVDTVYLDSTGVCHIVGPGPTPTPTPTPNVQSVVFETINSQVTADNPTNLGGGRRIFPDRQTPNDLVNRRIVRVNAQISQAIQGVRVYFRNFDVDDPSDDPNIDDNGILGNDNRQERGTAGSAGVLSAPSALTDSNGVATVEFMVTKQPGDNFVISATTDNIYSIGIGINGTGLQDASLNQLPTTRAKRTDMLSVWRKVHIEVDSMTTVGNNVTNGRIRSKGTVGSTPKWFNIMSNTGPLEPGRFQNGRMTFGSNNLEVLDNTDTALQIRSNNGNVTLFINGIFQLFDDDDFNDDDGPSPNGDGTLDGDDQENITFRGSSMFSETFSHLQPSTDTFQNPFAAAYVEPDYTWAEGQTGMNDPNASFRNRIDVTPNLFPVERPIVNENRDSESAEMDDFWVGYILIGYQAGFAPILGLDLDGDPIRIQNAVLMDGVVGGVSPTPTDASIDLDDTTTDSIDVKPGGIGSIIYIEGMRDFDFSILSNPNPPPTIIPDLRTRTVPHELGHQFGLRGDVPSFGLMSVNEIPRFVPEHINIIRWRLTSPGKPF
ncbi:MAG: hypothetical protein ACRD6X_01770 [Pyrinomonadaceae bacterium]